MSTRRSVLHLAAGIFVAMGLAPAAAQMSQPPAYYDPPHYQQPAPQPAYYQPPHYQQPSYQPYVQQSCCCNSGGLFSGLFSGSRRSPCHASGYGAYPQYQPAPYYPQYQQQYPAYQPYQSYPQYQPYPQYTYYPQTYPQPGLRVRLNVRSRSHQRPPRTHCFKSKGVWVCR